MDHFGVVLKHLLAVRGQSVSGWARRMGIAQGFASNMLSGRRRPPLEVIEEWADFFRLHGHERVRFIDLAVIAHLPAPAQQRFLRIIEQQALLQAEIARLRVGGLPAGARLAPAPARRRRP